MKIQPFLMTLMIAISVVLASCGSTTAPTTFTLGGTISGLNGTGLVLQYNGANNLSVTSNGVFVFANAIVSGTAYTVTILTQPSSPAQTCAITSGGTGTANSNIVTVAIACANNTFTVGGTVTGLTGTGLVLQDNGGSNLTINANGSFTFPTPANRGTNYNVTVFTQPSNPAQTCGVTNGVGTNLNGNVTDIQVNCFSTTTTFTIGGTVSGLSGAGLILQNNSGDNLSVSANGSFTFATPIASGATYSVTVLAQPSAPLQNCAVTGGGGTASANITGIQVNCTTVTFTIGGTITGLTGTGLVLQDNGGSNLSVSAGASTFTFASQVASGSTYAVSILTQPSGPSCSVANGSGTVTTSSVSNITIKCDGSAFNISATVSGLLPNTSVVLQDNGGDSLTIGANGLATNFNTPIATAAAYAVTVKTQPAGETCTVGANASGKVAGADINVAVSCVVTPSSGAAHTCVVTSAGGVQCWGSNEYGQLGNGSTANSNIPVQVVGLSSGVASVAAGYDSTCALTSAGAVWCWGNNASGQLGNGTFTQSNIPVEVLDSTGSAPLSGTVAISAGQSHACAVTGAGAALCWGDNSNGQLGNGSEIGSNLPVPVAGLSSGAATVSAGSGFTCAVTISGTAECWGEGAAGQLGDGNTAGTATPTSVLNSAGTAPLSGAVAVSAGFENTCALTNGGTVLCWGSNNSVQLGNGSAGPQSSLPVFTMNDATGQSALTDVVGINVGRDDACAVTSSGAALCWGRNQNGQLGNGSAASATFPTQVSGLSSGVAAIASGYDHTCAVTNTGAALCWGFNLDGQLGDGSTTTSPAPVTVQLPYR